MKIQCDVCNKDEASFFCVADEAALCHACDHRVHHANKLAGKHQRFDLFHPSPEQAPLCDICKERRAFLFCQQDRAILCRECDGPIHKANELTQKHNRFLLTGVKISANSAVYSSPSSSVTSTCGSVPNLKSHQDSSNKVVVASPNVVPGPISKATNTNSNSSLSVPPMAVAEANYKSGCGLVNVGADSLTSSLSEYLEMLPGYLVEELLDSSSPDGLCKIGDNYVFPFWDTDVESSLSSISSERAGVWVPQASPHLQQNQTQILPSATMAFSAQIGFKDPKASRKWTDDNSFAVPQIRPSPNTFKRSRTLWQ